MTQTQREKLEAFVNALDAYLEGREVQYRESPSAPWKRANEAIDEMVGQSTADYRIKPEPESFIIEFRNGKPVGLYSDDDSSPETDGTRFKRFVEAA